MNTPEMCGNIPSLNINDLFKKGLFFGPTPGFHIYYYHWRVYYFLKSIKNQNPIKWPKGTNTKKAKGTKEDIT